MRTIAARDKAKVSGRSLWRKALACAMSVVLVSGITMPGAFTALAAQAGDPSDAGGSMFAAENMFAQEDAHDFTYSSDGATITATCGNEDCSLNGKTATLTISATDGTYDGTTVFGATLADTENLKGSAQVQYQKKTGDDSWGEATAAAPTEAGEYKASITLTDVKTGDGTTGNVTASVEYTVAKADPTCSAPTGLTATYGQTLADVALSNPEGNTPGTWSWVDSTVSVGEIGTNLFSVQYTPTDTANYKTPESEFLSVTVGKATPDITTAPTASDIAYGQTLANSTLAGGVASVAGDFAWTDGTVAPAVADSGNTQYGVTFTPTDGTHYNTATCSVTLTVAKADPKADAPTGLTATYGQTLADVQLTNLDGNTAGTWAWVEDASTSVGDAGTNTFHATFTPEDAANYNSANNVNVEIAVGKATPTITTAPTASAITYGKTLADSTLSGGTASVEGAFAWADATTKPAVSDSGTTDYEVTFTPTDANNYNTATCQVKLAVEKAAPTAAAPTGLTATIGQTLADVTLTNPSSNTPGTWAWVEEATTNVGDIGTHTFHANFTPTDAANYNSAENVEVQVTVSGAAPTITTAPTASGITYGQTLSASTLNGGVASVESTTVEGTWAWADGTTKPAVSDSNSTEYDVVFTPNDTQSYSTATCKVTLAVAKANPTANAPTSLTATYGQTLANVQLTNPEGNTDGTWAWVDPDTTSVGNAGTNTFQATFTPADTANYNTPASVGVQINVGKAAVESSAVSMAGYTYGGTVATPSVTSNPGSADVAYYYNTTDSTENGTAWEGITPTTLDAGGYYMYAVIAASDNYEGYTTATQAFEVEKATPTITTPPAASGITYGDALSTSTLTGGEASVAGTFAWANGTTKPAVSDSNSTDYDVTFTPNDETNYNTATCQVKLTVQKADPKADAPEGLTATIGQTLADVTLTNPDGNTPGEWAWVDADSTSVGDVGTHSFKANFTPTDTANYNAASDIDVEVTVGKMVPTITTAPTASGITYGQTLADSTLSGGAASIAGTFAWASGTTKPTVSDSGTTQYDVIFTPEDQANYGTATCQVTLAVEKADPTANAPAGVTAAYGQTLADVALANPAGNTPGTWAWANSAASVGDIGTRAFKANFTPTDTANYNAATEIDVSVTVGPKDANSRDISVAQKSGEALTYNGSANAPTLVAKDGEVPVVTYSVSYKSRDDATYGPSSTAPVDAGAYTATLTFTGNYAGTRTVSFSIGPKPVTVTGLTVATKTYDGTTAATISTDDAVITGLVGSDDVEVGSVTGSFNNANAGTGKAVTISSIVLSGDQASNYTASSENITGTIAKATGTAAAGQKPTAKTGLVADGTSQALVSAPSALPEGYTEVQYSLDGGKTWSDEVPTGKEAGSYTVKVQYIGDANHEDFEGDDVSVTIAAAKDSVTTDVVVNDGAPQVSISNFDEVATSMLTTAEKAAVKEGATAKAWLEVSKVDKTAISTDDKSALEAAAKKLSATPSVWMDFAMWKQVEGFSKTAVHELSVPAKLTLEVPESLRKDDRTFYLICLHEGETKVVAEGTGDEISGEASLFSPYLLAYKDSTTKGASSNTSGSSAKTGDPLSALPVLPLVIVVVAAAGLALLAGIRLRRRQ